MGPLITFAPELACLREGRLHRLDGEVDVPVVRDSLHRRRHRTSDHFVANLKKDVRVPTHIALLRLEPEHLVVKGVGDLAVVCEQLVPDKGAGLVDEGCPDVLSGLPEVDDGTGRVGHDRHAPGRHHVEGLHHDVASRRLCRLGGGVYIVDRDVRVPKRWDPLGDHVGRHEGDGCYRLTLFEAIE